MTDSDEDEAALAWAGDEPERTPARRPAVARVEVREVVDAPAKPQMPAALLVSYGILAGAYLLYTVGWIVSVQRYGAAVATSPDPLSAFMFGVGEILAVLAPALWFGAALLLTRGRKPIIRLLALVVGIVVVVPWPFVLGVWQ